MYNLVGYSWYEVDVTNRATVTKSDSHMRHGAGNSHVSGTRAGQLNRLSDCRQVNHRLGRGVPADYGVKWRGINMPPIGLVGT